MTNLLQDNSIDKNTLIKDWAKGYRSQPNEYNYWIDEDEIEGTIPNALQGTLFRNGVGSLEVNGEKNRASFRWRWNGLCYYFRSRKSSF